MKNLVRTLRYRLLQLWFLLTAKELNLDGKVLVLAPHPDDEVLGCGGLLARMAHEGKDVSICFVSDGAASHSGCCNTPRETISAQRKQLALNASRALNIAEEKLIFLNLPDGNIPADFQLELPFHPDSILIPHWGEGWPDHLNTRQIGIRMAGANGRVYEYGVWMWYYNVWNIFSQKAYCLRMSPEEHKAKLNAIAAYTLPKAHCGKPWSGVLPGTFLKANSSKTEVYFLCKDSKR